MASKSSPPPQPLTPEEFSGLLAAHRQWVRSGGEEGQKADMSGANLEGLDLDGYDLSHLDFRGGNLARVRFGDALVEGASFRAADLREADLSKARGLLAPQLAGADLAGARLPEDIQEFAGLKHVDAASDHVQRLFFLLLLVCVYCWLTIAVTTDANLLNNFAEQALPIITTKINLVMFYWAAPFLLLCVYLYFHLCLQRLWEALAELPGVFADGLPLPHRVHPWLWNGLVWAYFPRLRDRRPPLLLLQKMLAILLVWWAGPLTLLGLWWRYLPAHHWPITILQLVFLTLALDGALGFSLLTRATLRMKERKPFRGKKPWRSVTVRALVFTTIAIAAFFYLLSLAAIDGLGRLKDGRPFPAAAQEEAKESFKPSQTAIKLLNRLHTEKAQSSFKPPRAFIELFERLIYGHPLAIADLREADVSLKPSQWTGKPGDLDLVRGALLRGRDLRLAMAKMAFLVKADLQGANLQHADLLRANLQQADLSGANLQHAKMYRANLQQANLQWAKLQHANLLRANLQQADLSFADLQQADLYGAYLQQANLQFAEFQGAKSLEKGQVMATFCWPLAKYSQEMLAVLKLPPEHNQNLKKRKLSSYQLPQANLWRAWLWKFDLSGANLQGANLEKADMVEADLTGADLRGANLKGADLREANLKGADLRGAKGLTREQLKSAIMVNIRSSLMT